MFGKKNAVETPDIVKDRKRKNLIFTVTFSITAIIILNLVLYLVTKV